jgi:hypothetical protein
MSDEVKPLMHVNPFEQFTTEERIALSRGEHAPGMIDPFTQRSDEEQHRLRCCFCGGASCCCPD